MLKWKDERRVERETGREGDKSKRQERYKGVGTWRK